MTEIQKKLFDNVRRHLENLSGGEFEVSPQHEAELAGTSLCMLQDSFEGTKEGEPGEQLQRMQDKLEAGATLPGRSSQAAACMLMAASKVMEARAHLALVGMA